MDWFLYKIYNADDGILSGIVDGQPKLKVSDDKQRNVIFITTLP